MCESGSFAMYLWLFRKVKEHLLVSKRASFTFKKGFKFPVKRLILLIDRKLGKYAKFCVFQAKWLLSFNDGILRALNEQKPCEIFVPKKNNSYFPVNFSGYKYSLFDERLSEYFSFSAAVYASLNAKTSVSLLKIDIFSIIYLNLGKTTWIS